MAQGPMVVQQEIDSEGITEPQTNDNSNNGIDDEDGRQLPTTGRNRLQRERKRKTLCVLRLQHKREDALGPGETKNHQTRGRNVDAEQRRSEIQRVQRKAR